MQLPLWLRTAVAIAILFATASSSYLVIALLIIPQAILNWLRKMIYTTLNRLGITKLLSTIWKYVIPADVQHKWYMHFKWKMGRRQVLTIRKLKQTISPAALQQQAAKNADYNSESPD